MGQEQLDRIRILKASTEHLDLVAPLFDAYRVFYQQPSNLTAASEFIRARLANEESVIYLATTGADDHLTALGFTQLYPSFSSISMKRLWILYDLFVVPQARRQGVAKALITQARQLAADTQAEGLLLDTAIDNYSAQALYKATGFKREDEFYTYHLTL
jgi:ribosomal protein S18 acetylase RimI-like enzyme